MMRGAFVILAMMWCAVGAMAQSRQFGQYELPKECRQVVVVSPKDGGYAMSLVEYDGEESNIEYFAPCSVGYRGIAAYGTKREGDGKTPEGMFALRRGLCFTMDFESRFPMEQYDQNDIWSEDPESPDYNTLVRDPLPENQGERLWARRETQFRYIVVVEYNTNPIVAGAGSAIFIHAWRNEGRPTAGCIGMAEENVRQLVEWLDPDKNPHIIILDEQH